MSVTVDLNLKRKKDRTLVRQVSSSRSYSYDIGELYSYYI